MSYQHKQKRKKNYAHHHFHRDEGKPKTLAEQAQEKLIKLSEQTSGYHKIHLDWKDQQPFKVNKYSKLNTQSQNLNKNIQFRSYRKSENNRSKSEYKMTNKMYSNGQKGPIKQTQQKRCDIITRYISLKIPKQHAAQQKSKRIHSVNQNSKSHQAIILFNHFVYKRGQDEAKMKDCQKQRSKRYRAKTQHTQRLKLRYSYNNISSSKKQISQQSIPNQFRKTFTINSFKPPEPLICNRNINCQNPYNKLMVHLKIKKDSYIRKILMQQRKIDLIS